MYDACRRVCSYAVCRRDGVADSRVKCGVNGLRSICVGTWYQVPTCSLGYGSIGLYILMTSTY